MNEPKIIAVIVTYNPDGDIEARMQAIARDVDRIIIVDNASRPEIKEILEKVQQQLAERCEMIWNALNKGLAAALNQGIAQAINNRADWILLLDHDSQPEPGMVAAMLNAYSLWASKEKVALIAPHIKDVNSTQNTRYLFAAGKFGFRRATLTAPATDQALTVITSGSLVKAELFELGMMPEAFFIDYIDHAFNLRLKAHGWNILLVRDAVLQHRLGEKTEHRIAGANIVASNHSALRRFYIFRNRIWVWKLFGRQFPGFVLHDLLAAGYDIFRILAFENEKLSKLKAIGKGIAAGMKRLPQN
jgi:rhamnosyltransferase